MVSEGHIDVIPRYCSLLLQTLNYQKAEEFVAKMLQKTEKDTQSLLILLLIYLHQNRYEEGRVVLKTLTSVNSDDLVVNALNHYMFLHTENEQLSDKFVALAKRIK